LPCQTHILSRSAFHASRLNLNLMNRRVRTRMPGGVGGERRNYSFRRPYPDCPAWAPTWRCKSSPKLTTAREVKRKGARVTERPKEAWSIIHEPTNRNRIQGAGDRGEWANDHEAPVTKGNRRRSGGCVEKAGVLTRGIGFPPISRRVS
jgi:hypothetical protein